MPLPSEQVAQFKPNSRVNIRQVSWSHRLAYISRILPEAIASAIRGCSLPAGARVVDYGCADRPYLSLFDDTVDYLGADLPGNPDATIEIGPDGRLALPDEAGDLVLSTQVIEHVGDPQVYLEECWRVLKPGGALVLSTHGLMVYHRDPEDYWRWTGDGLRRIVEQAGFEIERLEGVMGLAATGLQFVQDAILARLPRWLWKPYCALMQGLIVLMDRLHSPESRRTNAMVYLVVARKKKASGKGCANQP